MEKVVLVWLMKQLEIQNSEINLKDFCFFFGLIEAFFVKISHLDDKVLWFHLFREFAEEILKRSVTCVFSLLILRLRFYFNFKEFLSSSIKNQRRMKRVVATKTCLTIKNKFSEKKILSLMLFYRLMVIFILNCFYSLKVLFYLCSVYFFCQSAFSDFFACRKF